MLSILFFVFFGELIVQKSGIYYPVFYKNVVVDSEDIYVLVREEHQIKHYLTDGTFVSDIGRQGEGPGELNFPSALFYDETGLYVLNNGRIEIYDRNGQFQVQVQRPQSASGPLAKVENGWLVSPNPFGTRSFLYSFDFSDKKELVPELKENAERSSIVQSYDPTLRTAFPLVDPSGKFAYCADPNGLRVDIYDLGKGQKIARFEKDRKHFSVNKSWADEKGSAFAEKIKKFDPKFQLNLQIPDEMPLIRWMLITPEGYLAVRLWGKNPYQDNGELFVINEHGVEVDSICRDAECLQRVVWTHADSSIVLGYLDEELVIGRVEKSRLSAWLKDYPMTLPDR